MPLGHHAPLPSLLLRSVVRSIRSLRSISISPGRPTVQISLVGRILDLLSVGPPVLRGPPSVPVPFRAALDPCRHLSFRPVHRTWHVSCCYAWLGPGAGLAFAIAAHRRRGLAQPTELRCRMYRPRVEPRMVHPTVLSDLASSWGPRHQVTLPSACKQGVYQLYADVSVFGTRPSVPRTSQVRVLRVRATVPFNQAIRAGAGRKASHSCAMYGLHAAMCALRRQT